MHDSNFVEIRQLCSCSSWTKNVFIINHQSISSSFPKCFDNISVDIDRKKRRHVDLHESSSNLLGDDEKFELFFVLFLTKRIRIFVIFLDTCGL